MDAYIIPYLNAIILSILVPASPIYSYPEQDITPAYF